MNRRHTDIGRWGKLLFIPVLIAFFFSCQKDENGGVGGPATVNIQLKGAAYGSEAGKPSGGASASAGRQLVSGTAAKVQQTTIPLGDGLTLVATAVPVDQSSASSARASGSGQRAATPNERPLADSVVYRVLAYSQDGNLIGFHDYKVGNDGTSVPFKDVDLLIGSTYTFIAYSNGTETLPALSGQQTLSGATLALAHNQQFLFWRQDNRTLVAGSNTLEVALAHRFSQINSVQFDVAANVLAGQNFSAISDLRAVSNSSLSASLDGTVNYGSDTTHKLMATPAVQGSRTYLAPQDPPVIVAVEPVPEGSTNATLRLGSLAIGPVLKSNLPINFRFEPGVHYNIELTINSFTDDGIQIGDLIWARANLWYDAGAPEGQRYKIRENPLAENTDFWRFRTRTPDGSAQEADFDPCAEVLPKNTWRMPTRAEFGTLNNTPNQLLSQYHGAQPLDLVVYYQVRMQMIAQWNGTTIGTETGVLSLPMNGRLNTSGSPTDVSNYQTVGLPVLGVNIIPTVTGNGYYWTSESTGGVNNPYYARLNYSGTTLVAIDLLNLDLIHINIFDFDNFNRTPSNQFTILDGGLNGRWQNRLMIRCVRPATN